MTSGSWSYFFDSDVKTVAQEIANKIPAGTVKQVIDEAVRQFDTGSDLTPAEKAKIFNEDGKILFNKDDNSYYKIKIVKVSLADGNIQNIQEESNNFLTLTKCFNTAPSVEYPYGKGEEAKRYLGQYRYGGGTSYFYPFLTGQPDGNT